MEKHVARILEKKEALLEKFSEQKEKFMEQKETLKETLRDFKNAEDAIYQETDGKKVISSVKIGELLRKRTESLQNAKAVDYLKDLKQKGLEVKNEKYEVLSSCLKDVIENRGLYMSLEDSVENLRIRYNYRKRQPFILAYSGIDALLVGLFSKKIMGFSFTKSAGLGIASFGLVYFCTNYKYQRDIRLFTERMDLKYERAKKEISSEEESNKLFEVIDRTLEVLASDRNLF